MTADLTTPVPVAEAIPLLWWEFYQNNSGGVTYGPDHVDVQAPTAEEANALAEASGLVYFDDDYSLDCECCGARWSRVGDWATGTPEPEANTPPWTSARVRVYFDGSVEPDTSLPIPYQETP